jgi:hypothetical protein
VAEQNIFAEILSQFIAACQVPLRSHPTHVGMRSLTLASDEGDDLFLTCASLHSSAVQFSFASLTEVTPESVLSPIWLCADALPAIASRRPLLPGGPPAARLRIERSELGTLPRISLKD